MEGMTPGSQDASVEYPSEIVHAARVVLALPAVEWTLDMTVEGLQYIPPTGCTDNACGGEPRRETLMSHREFTSVGGRLAGTSELCVCWSVSGRGGAGSNGAGLTATGKPLRPHSANSSALSFPGTSTWEGTEIHCSGVRRALLRCSRRSHRSAFGNGPFCVHQLPACHLYTGPWIPEQR